MAIAYESTANNNNTPVAGVQTWTHTTTGSDQFLIVAIFVSSDGPNATCTVDGSSATLVDKAQQGASGSYSYMWYVKGLAAALHTIVVTTDGATYTPGGSTNYTGVLGSLDTSSKFSGTSQTSRTQSVTTTDDNCWAVMTLRWGGETVSASSGVTFRQNNSGYTLGDSNGPIHPAGSYSMVMTAASDVLGVVMAAFSPVAPPVGPANLKTYNTIAMANIMTIDTNAIANVKTLDTNA